MTFDFSRLFIRQNPSKPNSRFTPCNRHEWLGPIFQSDYVNYTVSDGSYATIRFHHQNGSTFAEIEVASIGAGSGNNDRFRLGHYTTGYFPMVYHHHMPSDSSGFDFIMSKVPEVAEWMLWHLDEIEVTNT